MTPTIVVPLDGSPAAEAAIPFALQIADRRQAQLMLTSVIAVTGEFATWLNTGVDQDDQEIGAWVEDRRTYLKGLIDSLNGRDVRAHVSVGRPTNMLVEFIDTVDDPIVVMASHGRELPEKGAVGRHTLRLIHHLAAPVFVVKHPNDGAMTPRDGITRVVVPLDGSGFSAQAIERTLQVIGDPAPSIHLVSVIEHEGGTGANRYEEFMRSAREAHAERLEQHAQELTERGHVTTWEVRAGDVEVEIATAAVDSNASMIAMSTHGRSGIANALLGSVAEGVLHRCRHPLLLIRPDED